MLNASRYVLPYLICVLIALNGCSVFDREEDIPAILRIDSFSLIDNPDVDEGALTHDITDAWVFIDGDLNGIYELPAEIPVLAEGMHDLLIGPGIKVSTISTLRDNYLFYQAYDERLDLEPGETITVMPSVAYRDEGDNYTYLVVEDFEDSFLEVEPNTNTDAEIRLTNQPSQVRSGYGSGIIQITDTTKAAWIRTSEDFVLPQLGKVVYLELDYYTQYDLVIGVHLNNAGVSDENVNYLTLKASESEEVEWKKAYVALTSVHGPALNMESAYIYFLPDLLSSTKTDGIILLDNIKILHQK